MMDKLEPTESVRAALTKNGTIYISITGLKVKGLWRYLLFFRHAIPSKIQADRSPGILQVAIKRVNGIEHTLTIWENRRHMQKYVWSGAHKRAVAAFRKIATGKTIGYEGTSVPSWDEVHRI
jgi:hypothetical protein